MISPIRQFQNKLVEHKIDAYLVTKDVDIRYLTDFPASESWLLVTPKTAIYITDFRYALEARRILSKVKVFQYKESIIQALLEFIKSAKAKRIGFDDRHMSVALFQKINIKCPRGIKFFAKNDLIEQLREIKSKDEVKKIRRAIALNLNAFKYLKRIIKPGLSEKELLFRLECYVKAKGATFSFDPIIASGANACFPHARVTARKFRKNDSILIDMGININGYKSDLTRMFFLGKIPPHIRDIVEAVKIAQKKAIEKIKPGVRASEIDQQARKHLEKNKLAKFFGHSLGHGVGLEIHEAPRISEKNSAVLKEGMVFTVEPAVYIPKKFGVRIEDMVLVTSKGCEMLSRR